MSKYKKQLLEIKDHTIPIPTSNRSAVYGDDVLWVGNTFGLGAMWRMGRKRNNN